MHCRLREEIRETLHEKNAPWLSFGFLIIFLGIILSVLQQFVGINVVLYYAGNIFRNMGASTDTSLLQTIIVGAINMLFTVIAIFTVDRFGRKPLMITGALIMAVSMFSLGFSFFLQPDRIYGSFLHAPLYRRICNELGTRHLGDSVRNIPQQHQGSNVSTCCLPMDCKPDRFMDISDDERQFMAY